MTDNLSLMDRLFMNYEFRNETTQNVRLSFVSVISMNGFGVDLN